MLGQRELARTLFPVGDLTKADVRAHAARLGLRTAAKPESMDVCFITRGGRRVVPHRTGAGARRRDRRHRRRDGGPHDGVATFTVGQRRGLGVATGERRYVVDVDARTATVTIGAHGDLLRDAVEVRDLALSTDGAPSSERPDGADARARRTGRGDARRERRSGSRARSRGSRPARWSRSTTATCSSAAGSLPDRRREPAGAAPRPAGASRPGAPPRTGSPRSRPSRRRVAARAARTRSIGLVEPGRHRARSRRRGGDRGSSAGAAAAGSGATLADVLAQEEDRVGQGQRVDDDEPGRHEHRPAARQRLERPAEHGDERGADQERDDAEDDLTVGQEQHRRRRPRPRRGDVRRAAGRGTTPAERAVGSVARRRTRGRSRLRTRCRGPRRASSTRSSRPTRRSSRASTALRRSRRAIAATTNAGAITRSAVNVCGRGASVARSPTAHASQSSVAAATRGPSAHDSVAAAAAGPAVSGNVTQATRSSHRKRGRGRLTPFTCTRARLEHAASAIVEYDLMSPTLRAPVLVPGVATGVGSLPHDDPVAAAEVVLRCLPELPAAPQLPGARPAGGHARPVARGAARGRAWRPTVSFTVVHDSDAAPDCDFGDGGARRASSRSSSGCGPRSKRAGPGQGPGHRAR